VVLIVTDDQGYGDLSCTGNPVLRTPQLDALYRDSVRLTNFHVDPTCSPTRAALMTGRYSTRTGVWHTVMGRHMPRADEQMMPQVFADNGYATAMFGKWHLGDNFPFRPHDRGFQEVLIHGGGGVGQIPDYWGNDYFDDTYFRNGRPEQFSGYCTDVFFREATRFIESHTGRPFFVYLATNAPHGPYRVADEWSKPYTGQVGDDAELANFYGMIANIDHNVGRMRKRLEELGLADNTLLIFMTDNGTARGATFSDYRGNDGRLVGGYNAGMRGKKGSPYEGGHHVPCFLHWPKGGLTGGRDVDGLAAHIDLLPTLIDVCGLKQSGKPDYDGVSLRDALTGKSPIPADRLLLAHHQELPEPEKYRFACVMQGPWRLILRSDVEGATPATELFHLRDDPGQARDVSSRHSDIAETLRGSYESWWDGLSTDFDRAAEIVIGDEGQNPTQLTCFEWHSSRQWWQTAVERGFEGNGHWKLRMARPGKYEISLRRWPAEAEAAINEAPEGGTTIRADTARLRIGDVELRQPIPRDAQAVAFEVSLPAGSLECQTWLTSPDGASRGAYYATIHRVAGD
jgi:arylsulfatase A-like enzyme